METTPERWSMLHIKSIHQKGCYMGVTWSEKQDAEVVQKVNNPIWEDWQFSDWELCLRTAKNNGKLRYAELNGNHAKALISLFLLFDL